MGLVTRPHHAQSAVRSSLGLWNVSRGYPSRCQARCRCSETGEYDGCGSAIRTASTHTISRFCSWQVHDAVNQGQRRFLNVHEYISMGLMRGFGVPVPAGAVAATPEEAERIYSTTLQNKTGKWILLCRYIFGSTAMALFCVFLLATRVTRAKHRAEWQHPSPIATRCRVQGCC